VDPATYTELYIGGVLLGIIVEFDIEEVYPDLDFSDWDTVKFLPPRPRIFKVTTTNGYHEIEDRWVDVTFRKLEDRPNRLELEAKK
jgi:hypothetical protein